MKKEMRRGFTLIEILVVVAIMALLAALLLSVFGRVREQGRRTTCQSNLRQIALAMQSYVSDNQSYPVLSYVANAEGPIMQRHRVTWSDIIAPYLKSSATFHCPDKDEKSFELDGDYAYNRMELNRVSLQTTDGNHPFTGVLDARVASPTTTILNFDNASWTEGGPFHYCAPTPTHCGAEVPVTNLHSDGANYSFADGHVKWLSRFQAGQILPCSQVMD